MRRKLTTSRAEHRNAVIKMVKEKRMILIADLARVMNNPNIKTPVENLVKEGKIKRQKIKVRGLVGNMTNQWLVYENTVTQNEILDFEREAINRTFQSPLVENHCYKSPDEPIGQNIKSNVVDIQKYIEINNTELTIKEFKGNRVVTFKDIDELHQRPSGTARQTFNRNDKRFKEGIDYFVCQTYEAQNMGITAPNGIKLLTEKGYLKLVKPFSDDLSWEIQGMLIDSYFKVQEIINKQESNLPITKPDLDMTGIYDVIQMFSMVTTDLNNRVKSLEGTIESMKKAITA